MTPTPLPDPSTFAVQVTNQFFPLTPGASYQYASSDGWETNTVEVLTDTKTILGIQATIVHDQVVGLTLEHPVATPSDRSELVDRAGP